MNQQICHAAATQKYQAPIRIKTLRTHEGGKQFTVCEMRRATDEIRQVHESAPSWDGLFFKLTGINTTEPKDNKQRPRKKVEAAA